MASEQSHPMAKLLSTVASGAITSGVAAIVTGTIAYGLILWGALLLLSVGVVHLWHRRVKKTAVLAPTGAEKRRIGYLGRETGRANLRHARFGEKLDTAIDNAGEVDASEAKFGVSEGGPSDPTQ